MKWNHWLSLVIGLGLFAAFFGGSPSAKDRMAAAQTERFKQYLPMVYRGDAPPAPNSPPTPTTSYYFYMGAYSATKARDLGCALGGRDLNTPGKQDSLVILDFGITQYKDGQYGASGMKINGFYTTAQIAEAVEWFGVGYWQCTGADYDSHLTIGIGTNNYTKSYSNLSVTYNHGRAWAQMVNSVNTWFQTVCTDGCNGQVHAAGANDIELAWSSPGAAQDWVNGYDSANLYPLYNFGAAEGCPNACGGGGFYWTKEDVWKVTNAGPIFSVPEIYLNDGRNAQQWYQLSLYSVQAHGIPYNFAGVMTTWGACQQGDDPSCPYIDNTPQEGWTQLYNLVNNPNSPSTWDSIPYSTDIKWLE